MICTQNSETFFIEKLNKITIYNTNIGFFFSNFVLFHNEFAWVALNFRPHANWINFQTAKFISELPNIQIRFHFPPVFFYIEYNFTICIWNGSTIFHSLLEMWSLLLHSIHFSHAFRFTSKCIIATKKNRVSHFLINCYRLQQIRFLYWWKIYQCTTNCEFKALSILYISNTFNVCGIEYENSIQKLFEKCPICVEVNSLLMMNRSK